jgi:hypothetical protein
VKADPKHDHIDGAVALAMAVSRAMAGTSTQSAYNAPDAGGITIF